ncbi:MAG: AMP-binding protein, partial [Caldilinea sp.]
MVVKPILWREQVIWIDGRWWDIAALAEGVEIAAASEQVQAVLDFSRAWLRGEERFEVHTSGSTGLPKPIQLTRSQMEASARATCAVLGLTAGMTALVCLPVRYIAGRMLLVRGFVWGLKLVVVEPASDPLAELPGDAAIDLASFVPLQMQTLLDRLLPADSPVGFPDATVQAVRYRHFLDSMHAILVGGGPVSPTLATQIRQIKTPVYHTYGMTETATHVALRRLNGLEATSAFVPLPGVDIGVDGRSCLHLRGPMTDGATIQTNDQVELQPDGSFVWIGRWD